MAGLARMRTGGAQPPALTWQVDLCERVPGGGPGRRQEVDRLVVDVVAVAQVQAGQRRHLLADEAQGRVGDVEARQPQVLHVPQLAAIIQLTCGGGRGAGGQKDFP